MKKKTFILMVVGFGTCDTVFAESAIDIFGSIRNRSGEPIVAARVMPLTQVGPGSESLGNGLFRVRAAGPVLIDHPAYEPFIFLAREGMNLPLELHLSVRSDKEWVLPACPGDRSRSPLKALRLQFPPQVKTRVSRDSDFELLIASTAENANLEFWKSVISSGVPRPAWFENVSSITTIRSLDLAETKGYDIRADTKSGGKSRWVGCIYTFLAYSDLPDSVARIFDSIIDGVCYTSR